MLRSLSYSFNVPLLLFAFNEFNENKMGNFVCLQFLLAFVTKLDGELVAQVFFLVWLIDDWVRMKKKMKDGEKRLNRQRPLKADENLDKSEKS